MKILVLSHMYPHNLEPAKEVFVEEEVNALAKSHQIKVVSPVPYFPPIRFFKKWYQKRLISSHEVKNSVEIFRPRFIALPRALFYFLAGYSYLFSVYGVIRKIRREFGFEIIHAHNVYPDGFAAVILGTIFRKKVVITAHGLDVNGLLKQRSIRFVSLSIIGQADKIIAVSSSLKDELIKLGIRPGKIEIIHNGVDVNRFYPMDKNNLLEHLKLAKGTQRIIYVGGIIWSKGLKYLLEAFKIVKEKRGRVELLMLGGVTGTYWEREAAEIKNLTKELAIDESVKFLGKMPNEKIPQWMNLSDVLILPSLSEGFGVVLIEALSCGIPVISTKCGGPQDIVNDKVGELIDPKDPDGLAEAVIYVLENREKYDSAKLRDYAVRNFAYGVISEKITDLYNRLNQHG